MCSNLKDLVLVRALEYDLIWINKKKNNNTVKLFVTLCVYRTGGMCQIKAVKNNVNQKI